MRYIILLLIPFSIWACKTQQNASILKLSSQHEVLFLDSTAASVAINVDERDHFFENIQELEMAIQMKTPLAKLREGENSSRYTSLEKYKKFLAQDVESFTKKEILFVNEVMNEAFALCNGVSETIFPERIRLIKTKANHYGESVYYTREDIIVIPHDALKARDKESFLKVMLHEISHIYSRYNDQKREDLYALIGFYPLEKRLLMEDKLRERVLHNPDGIDFNFYIELGQSETEKIKAIPIIVASKNDYETSTPAFFGYLKFDMYEIKENPTNTYSAISDENGFSTIQLNQYPDFFTQIKDNTNYIIHPDEIIADNFMFVILAEKKEGKFEGYSPAGTQLLEDIKTILTQ